jgi:hypothetical protein
MSLNTSSILSAISAMEQQLAALRAQLGGVSVVTSSPVKTTTEKKPRKKSDAPPSAWRLFADRVRALLGANGYSGKALGTECVQFCSSLKDENGDFSSWADADILARRAAWTAPVVSKQAERGDHWKNGKKVATPTGSVVSDGEADGGAAPAVEEPKKVRKNPWADLSPEQREAKVAAMKAGRAAKKAATESAAPVQTDDGELVFSDSGDLVESAPAPAPAPAVDAVSDGGSSVKKARKPWSAETKAAAKAKRDAKKAAAATSSTAAVLPPLPASPESVAEQATEFQGIMLGGTRYLVNLVTGHCYRRESDGSQGEWAGLFHRTGGPKNNGPWIDTAVPEPSFTDLDELD